MRLLRISITAALIAGISPGAVKVSGKGGRWSLENTRLLVTVDAAAGAVSVRDKAARYEWRQPTAAAARPFRDVRRAESAGSIEFTAALADAAGSERSARVRISLAATGGDLFVETSLANPGERIDSLAFLPGFVPRAVDASLAIADYSNGHLYPLALDPFPKKRLSVSNLDMPWFGVCDSATGAAYALILETPDDARIEMAQVEAAGRKLTLPRIVWVASKGEFRYARKVIYHFAATGGYVALAKRYRAYAGQQGLLVTFREKLKKNPNIARLFGAPDVWGDGTLAFAREAKKAGVEKMLIHTSPSVARRTGVTPEEMREINELGYLTSTYDNYTDIMALEPGRAVDNTHDVLPDHAVLKADSTRMTAWLTWDKKQFMKRCPTMWVPAARAVIPPDIAKYPYLGRFIDVTTAEDLYECYDPNHPLTRTEKRGRGVELLGYVRSLGLVAGGEHGRWWAVPHLDYIEGMMSGGSYSWPAGHLLGPKTKDQKFEGPSGSAYPPFSEYEKWGIGHRYRVPLWELVFHDCIVSTWYWGDSNDFLLEAAPEVTLRKDAFNILYGTMPMLWADRRGSWAGNREAFLRTCRNTSKMHAAVAQAEMLSHEFVTPDGAVQRTRFSDGTEAVVNFGNAPYRATLGKRTYLLPENGFAVEGPHVRQSLELVDGKSVTRVEGGNSNSQ